MKRTLNNLMNQYDDLLMKQLGQQSDDGCGFYSDTLNNSDDNLLGLKLNEMRKLIGGNYGTDDWSVYEGIYMFIATAREAKQWQEYAFWLEEELSIAKGEEEGDYYHEFFAMYSKNKMWDNKENNND